MKSNKPVIEKTASQTTEATQSVQAGKTLKLRKNHGMIHGKNRQGRICAFYEAGSQFDAVDDAELIAMLVQSGAELDE